MKKEDLKTDEFVILIDAGYLDETVGGMRDYFAPIVHRNLPKVELAAMLEGVALDAGIRPGNNQIDVILIYDRRNPVLKNCNPSDLNEDLHCVAFQSSLGEFQFSSFSTEGMTTREAMYADFAGALSVSTGTKLVMLVGDVSTFSNEVVEDMKKAKERTICYFGMEARDEKEFPFPFHHLGFAILHALGVKPGELE